MNKSLPMPQTLRRSTSQARDQLAEIIDWVQNPRHCLILTRYGRDVAAIVSKEELARIDNQHEIEEITKYGKHPVKFTVGTHGYWTNAEGAEHIQKLQMDRRMEREVLKKAGLKPVQGGELEEVARVVPEVFEEEVVERVVAKKRRWWFW